MDPNSGRRPRRVHGAELKSKVLGECRRPGASVSAVALAYGLNANLVRKWLQGRGLQRVGLEVEEAESARPESSTLGDGSTARLQFVPVEVSAPSKSIEASAALRGPDAAAQPADCSIDIELRRGGGQVVVRWPASQAGQCAVWLRDLAAAMLK